MKYVAYSSIHRGNSVTLIYTPEFGSVTFDTQDYMFQTEEEMLELYNHLKP